MEIKQISESDFNQIESIRQIVAHDYSHQFAQLDLGEHLGIYGLSWRSQLVDPIVKQDKQNNTIWVGVDLQLSALNLKTGRLVVAIPLTAYIVEILIMDEVTVAITENEVLIFNPGGALRDRCGLPDIPEDISVVDTNLVITTLSGDCVSINPIAGRLKKEPLSV